MRMAAAACCACHSLDLVQAFAQRLAQRLPIDLAIGKGFGNHGPQLGQAVLVKGKVDRGLASGIEYACRRSSTVAFQARQELGRREDGDGAHLAQVR